MLLQILHPTPTWVFVLFAALLALGLSQMRQRQATLRRVTLLPLAMMGLAGYGLVSAFGDNALPALLLWACTTGIMALLTLQMLRDDGSRYDPALARFTLPGSVWPMLLILGIFSTKYAVGVSLALHPELAQDLGFALSVSATYGLFSGLFAARALRLWRLVPRSLTPVAAL